MSLVRALLVKTREEHAALLLGDRGKEEPESHSGKTQRCSRALPSMTHSTSIIYRSASTRPANGASWPVTARRDREPCRLRARRARNDDPCVVTVCDNRGRC